MNTPAVKANYRPDIDGLRAVAVLAVVLHHLSSPLVPGGYVGVDVFFVISGYLITGIVSGEVRQGTFSFASFYERRARRIFPALFVVLATTLAVGWFLLLPSDYAGTLRGALGTMLFASNMVFWRDMAAGYFAATDASLNPLLHTWSLAVEEQFYVFFPILLLVCFRRARRALVPVLVVGALVSLAGAALLVNSKSVAVFFLSPFRAWELLAGALLALGAVPPLRSRVLRETMASAGLLAILAACFAYSDKTTFPGLAALAPVLGSAALIHAGASGNSIASRMLQWRPMVAVGLISYSLYLWHWPLVVFVRYAFGLAPLGVPVLVALLVASLALAYLSYRFIEQPFRRAGGATRRWVFGASAVGGAVLAGVAGIGVLNAGFESRFSPEVVRLDKMRTAPFNPYVHCDERPAGEWCQLGNATTAPTTLLWGDSHMLAWAPALEAVYRERKQKAVFVPVAACPPLVGLTRNFKNPRCPGLNATVKSYLEAHPEIKTVVLAAYWHQYFREEGPLVVSGLRGTAAAERGLADVLNWLTVQHRQVVLVGPVPVYDRSVPFVLALEMVTGRMPLRSTREDQYRMNAPFWRVANAVPAGALYALLDPIEWLCSGGGECVSHLGGEPLYGDGNHLNVAGALLLKPQLATALPLQAEDAVLRASSPAAELATPHQRIESGNMSN